jgi:hypothetical protein
MESDDRFQLRAIVFPDLPAGSQESVVDQLDGRAGQVVTSEASGSDAPPVIKSPSALRPLSRQYSPFVESMRSLQARADFRIHVDSQLRQGMCRC